MSSTREVEKSVIVLFLIQKQWNDGGKIFETFFLPCSVTTVTYTSFIIQLGKLCFNKFACAHEYNASNFEANMWVMFDKNPWNTWHKSCPVALSTLWSHLQQAEWMCSSTFCCWQSSAAVLEWTITTTNVLVLNYNLNKKQELASECWFFVGLIFDVFDFL